MNAAFLFPGQGSQRPGMLRCLPDHPAVHSVLQQTTETLGFDVESLDTESALRSTVNAQLSLLATGVAVARALMAEGVCPIAVAGLSVGAFGAAAVSGALSYPDIVRLVYRRAALMESKFTTGFGMAVIVGLDEYKVAEIVNRISTQETPVFPANVNAPRQITIAGTIHGIDRVLEVARECGARKTELLPVPTLSHCPLLKPVVEALRDMAQGMHVTDPTIPYIGNIRGRVLRKGSSVVSDAIENVAHGVRWHDSVSVLPELGCELFLEMNPGRILCDLAEESLPGIRCIPMESHPLRYPLTQNRSPV